MGAFTIINNSLSPPSQPTHPKNNDYNKDGINPFEMK
jgi:hypothetical protein